MKKLLIILLFIFCCIFSYSQTIHSYDYIIDMNYYKSYYSKSIKAPSFVIYKLYNGGGDINRSSYSFKGYKDLTYFNYVKSGYDRGHLVPAEDFANSILRLKSTFSALLIIIIIVKALQIKLKGPAYREQLLGYNN